MKPRSRHVLRICRAEFCRNKGSEDLIEHVEKRLGLKLGETTVDGSFSLDSVYCLGNYAFAPSVLFDGKPYGPISARAADALIEDVLRRMK